MKRTDGILPELLAPAGSFDALRAAVSAGADAVYFGAKTFSARAFADNFGDDSLRSAIRYCRDFGVKAYITVNTQLFDRETEDAAELIRNAANMGADAFITADLGLARIIKKLYPGIELHASTQMSGQNVYSAEVLSSLGFSRMVVPREISFDALKILTKNSPVETEMFIHGALCVSHSGQCLMSSVIGGRSGNRGECAQPCRLPYDCKSRYPLSLKDICLAGHMNEILSSGVSSLKIEGRMKNAGYVYGVTEIYRRLLDERRNATPDEIESLGRLFSRSGFTSGYFTGDIGSKMLGVRTADDKRDSAQSAGAAIPDKKITLELSGKFVCGEQAMLYGSANVGGADVVRTVKGNIVRNADGGGMDPDRIRSSLCKLGNTIFTTDREKIRIETDDSASMSVAEINALRRSLCEALESAPLPVKKTEKANMISCEKRIISRQKTAYFNNINSVSAEAIDNFDKIFVPLSEYQKAAEGFGTAKLGIAFPPVAFDNELEKIKAMTENASGIGCKTALITGLWQIPIAKKHGLEMTGDIRLNVCNSRSAEAGAALGMNEMIISCEAGLARSSAIKAKIRAGVVVYGRLPLMTLEKCAIRDICGFKNPRSECHFCDNGKFTTLTDRMGVKFILSREEPHRNILWNSVPVWMADKHNETDSAGLFTHYIFTDENANAVKKIINSFNRGESAQGAFKRI